ncbi:hypothetical protein BT63DRAFT_450751 [Microthyrium microscopicum]|uniref:Uncharacterized protein n=1 Tax=Microthyrium microscopicum TaxID=703497 RepID=A0A6A6UM18_9PEZI|nr:hypothetical protein BT63DRAFT_450751 [Microthyrium microscopicum]
MNERAGDEIIPAHIVKIVPITQNRKFPGLKSPLPICKLLFPFFPPSTSLARFGTTILACAFAKSDHPFPSLKDLPQKPIPNTSTNMINLPKLAAIAGLTPVISDPALIWPFRARETKPQDDAASAPPNTTDNHKITVGYSWKQGPLPAPPISGIDPSPLTHNPPKSMSPKAIESATQNYPFQQALPDDLHRAKRKNEEDHVSGDTVNEPAPLNRQFELSRQQRLHHEQRASQYADATSKEVSGPRLPGQRVFHPLLRPGMKIEVETTFTAPGGKAPVTMRSMIDASAPPPKKRRKKGSGLPEWEKGLDKPLKALEPELEDMYDDFFDAEGAQEEEDEEEDEEKEEAEEEEEEDEHAIFQRYELGVFPSKKSGQPSNPSAVNGKEDQNGHTAPEMARIDTHQKCSKDDDDHDQMGKEL